MLFVSCQPRLESCTSSGPGYDSLKPCVSGMLMPDKAAQANQVAMMTVNSKGCFIPSSFRILLLTQYLLIFLKAVSCPSARSLSR